MKLTCKELDPSTDCQFEATGNTREEVAEKMMKHMRSAHADKMKAMNMSDDEMMEMFKMKAHM